MSAHAQAQSRKFADRAVILIAGAGLVGLALTVTAAGLFIFGGAKDPIRTTIDQSKLLEPGYVDYGLRQPEAAAQPLQPGYVDFGLRQRAVPDVQQPAYVDFGLRHSVSLPAAALTTAAGEASRNDDYGVRCLSTGWCSVYPGNPQPSGMGTH